MDENMNDTDKQDELEQQKFNLSVTKYWKQAIVGLLDIEELRLPKDNWTTDKKRDIRVLHNTNHMADLTYFLKLIKFDEKLLVNDSQSTEEATITACRMIFQKLSVLGFINFDNEYLDYNIESEMPVTGNFGQETDRHIAIDKVYINEKGLEVALKMQEHFDNEQRYIEQSKISTVLKDNSSNSLKVSIGALVCVFIGFVFSYERIQIAEDQLMIAQEQLIIASDRLVHIENSRLSELTEKRLSRLDLILANITATQSAIQKQLAKLDDPVKLTSNVKTTPVSKSVNEE